MCLGLGVGGQGCLKIFCKVFPALKYQEISQKSPDLCLLLKIRICGLTDPHSLAIVSGAERAPWRLEGQALPAPLSSLVQPTGLWGRDSHSSWLWIQRYPLAYKRVNFGREPGRGHWKCEGDWEAGQTRSPILQSLWGCNVLYAPCGRLTLQATRRRTSGTIY